MIREQLCIGCQSCKDACPFDVPSYSAEHNKTYKCTQCYDRVENGLKQACVSACPTGALFSGSREEVQKEARRRAEHYSRTMGIRYAVYGSDKVNFYVGKLGWMTIAPEHDAACYRLPGNPYRPFNVLRDLFKIGGGFAAVAAVAGASTHFMHWLGKRKQLIAAEERLPTDCSGAGEKKEEQKP